MKEIKIKVPEGYEIDKEKSSFERIIFKKKEGILPKSWEELTQISGFYVNGNSVYNFEFCKIAEKEKSVFRTKAQAKSALAKAQLSQLMYVYNDGWEPDWGKDNTKYTINKYKNRINDSFGVNNSCFLAFETEEIRDKFLENFKPLIKQYLMIE